MCENRLHDMPTTLSACTFSVGCTTIEERVRKPQAGAYNWKHDAGVTITWNVAYKVHFWDIAKSK